MMGCILFIQRDSNLLESISRIHMKKTMGKKEERPNGERLHVLAKCKGWENETENFNCASKNVLVDTDGLLCF